MSKINFPKNVHEKLVKALQRASTPIGGLVRNRGVHKGHEMASVEAVVMNSDVMNDHPIFSTRERDANLHRIVNEVSVMFVSSMYAYERLLTAITDYSTVSKGDSRFVNIDLTTFMGVTTTERKLYHNNMWRIKKIINLLASLSMDCEDVETYWSSMLLTSFNTEQELVKYAHETSYRTGMAIVQPSGTGAAQIITREDITDMQAAGVELINGEEWKQRAHIQNEMCRNIVGRMLDGMLDKYQLACAVLNSMELTK